MDKFSIRLKELRTERGLSLGKLAQKTGITPNAISLWERGLRVPNAQAIITLAKFFGVTTDYLLGVED